MEFQLGKTSPASSEWEINVKINHLAPPTWLWHYTPYWTNKEALLGQWKSSSHCCHTSQWTHLARDMKYKVLCHPPRAPLDESFQLLTNVTCTFTFLWEFSPACKFCRLRKLLEKFQEKTFDSQRNLFNGRSKNVCQLQDMLIKLANTEHLLGISRRRWMSNKSTWHECLDKTANNSWMGTETVYWVEGLTFCVRCSGMNGIFGCGGKW